jgi:predicted PurR-regulated permease PerM
MGFMSLLPAIGTGIVWVPVAIYLLVTGDVWQGAVLVACGVLIISAVDNLVRPILVGRETRIPDFIVLVSTLGGIQMFGFHGIVVGPLLAALFLTMWEMFAATQTKAQTPQSD